MAGITVKDEEVDRALSALVARLTNPTEAMQDIGEYMVGATRARFAAGTAPDGTPWAAKSLATIASYRSLAGKRPNSRVDTRPLFGPTGALSSTISYQADETSVEIGSALVYAATMQFGAAKGAFGQTGSGRPIPFGDIPARPFLGVSETDRESIGAIIAEWLGEGIDN